MIADKSVAFPNHIVNAVHALGHITDEECVLIKQNTPYWIVIVDYWFDDRCDICQQDVPTFKILDEIYLHHCVPCMLKHYK